MATSSIFGAEPLPRPVPGRDTDALGPSDNSDSGSDAQGAYGDGEMASDSDAAGTGERASIEGMDRPDSDILPDHLVREDDPTSDGELLTDEDIEDLEDIPLDEDVEPGDEPDA